MALSPSYARDVKEMEQHKVASWSSIATWLKSISIQNISIHHKLRLYGHVVRFRHRPHLLQRCPQVEEIQNGEKVFVGRGEIATGRNTGPYAAVG